MMVTVTVAGLRDIAICRRYVTLLLPLIHSLALTLIQILDLGTSRMQWRTYMQQDLLTSVDWLKRRAEALIGDAAEDLHATGTTDFC